MLKVQLSQQGKALFQLMNSPCARAGEAVMAIVRETLSISADAATPLRSAALDEGIIVKHLLIALQPATAKTLSDAANGTPLRPPSLPRCPHVHSDPHRFNQAS